MMMVTSCQVACNAYRVEVYHKEAASSCQVDIWYKSVLCVILLNKSLDPFLQQLCLHLYTTVHIAFLTQCVQSLHILT